MCEHHDEWQYQSLPQDLTEAVSRLILGSHDYVVSDAFHCLPDSFRFLGENGGGERFGEKKEGGDLDEDGEDGG